jgi:hypothetical protein
VLVDLCDHQVGGEARAEVDHAKADQVRMTRDVGGMFDELKLWRTNMLPFILTKRGFRPNWNRRAPNWQGCGGHDGSTGSGISSRAAFRNIGFCGSSEPFNTKASKF